MQCHPPARTHRRFSCDEAVNMPPAPNVWSTADSFLATGFFCRSRIDDMESCPCRRENWAWGVEVLRDACGGWGCG